MGKHSLCSLLVLACTALALPASAAAGGYATIMFGRGQITEVTGKACTPTPGSVSLWTIADDLRQRGLTATAPVTPSQIADAPDHICTGGSLYPNWSDLDTLRDAYGWSMVPRGLTSDSLQSVTDPAILEANVCGALQPLYQHGHSRAWGMYAWPQNRWTETQEETYVPKCYAYGRRYAAAGKSNALPIPPPAYWAYTVSINGGKCANTALACHTFTPKGNRDYMQPSALAATFNQALSGRWAIVQWYKIVSGSYSRIGRNPAWDCTSLDPRDHWTSAGELYCYNDYQAVISSIDPTITVTDPAGVALATGRQP